MMLDNFSFNLRVSFIAIILCFFFGCAPATISDVRRSIGPEYHVLKFPVNQHNIGSEWSKKFNATGKGMLSEDKIKVEKSLKRMDRGTAKQVALGIMAISNSGVEAHAGVEADVIKQIALQDLHLVKPVSLGYISFKPGLAYVTEALRLQGFSIGDEKKLKAQVGLTGTEGASAGSGAGTESNSDFVGEGLVIGYIVQTVDNQSYAKQEYGPVQLALNKYKIHIKEASVSAAATYEKVIAGSGKSLPKNLLWACKRAASKKDSINAAWVITLNIAVDEKKTLKIAFPAHPEIEECSEFESVITTGINSVTDKIERTVARITIDKASVNEMIEPTEFSANITVTKESFTLTTINADL